MAMTLSLFIALGTAWFTGEQWGARVWATILSETTFKKTNKNIKKLLDLLKFLVVHLERYVFCQQFLGLSIMFYHTVFSEYIDLVQLIALRFFPSNLCRALGIGAVTPCLNDIGLSIATGGRNPTSRLRSTNCYAPPPPSVS